MAGEIALSLLITANDMASKVISGIGAKFGPLGVGMAAIGVAAVAVGAQAVKMAGDFQASMTRLVTSAGELPQNLQMISNGILQLSVSTGTSYQQLAAGMYYVESSGYHAANALRVLQVAAQGAKSENADLTEVSKALTTVMADYHMPVSQAASAMNGLIATVQNGKTSLQDLTSSMGQVLPIASALHISFPQVAGAMDTMTNAGMSSRQAAMNLAHVLVALQAPSGVATKSMKEVGLSAQQVRDALVNQGLPQALQLIEDHVGKKFPEGSVANTTALKNIMGGLVGLKLAAMLTGGSLKETENNIAKVSAAMKNGGQAVMGWSEVQGTFNFKLDQMKSAFDALLITLGTRLLPIVGNVVGSIAGLISQFTQFVSTGGRINPVLSTIWNAFQNIAHSLSGIVVPALTVARQIFMGLQTVLGAAGQAIMSWLLPAIENLTAVLGPVIARIVQWVANSGILPFLFNAIAIVVRIIVGALSILANILAAVINFFANTALGAALFKAILVTLAIALGIIGIIILSVVIPAFIAWVAGAIAVGIANVIAFWPIILIILAIVAVVTVVILIITHWGAIMSWLGGVFGAIGKFIGNVFSAIGTTIHNVLSAVGAFIGNFFSMIGTWIHQRLMAALAIVTTVWNAIKTAFSVALNWIVNLVKNIFSTIGGWFTWLYNHNTYIKELCDFIKNFFQGAITWIRDAWTNIVNWLVDKWNGLKTTAGNIFSAIGTFIHDKIMAVATFLYGKWTEIKDWLQNTLTGIKNFFGNIFSQIGTVVHDKIMALAIWMYGIWEQIKSNVVSKVTDLKNMVGNAFSALGTDVHNKVTGLWNWLVGFANGWPAQAFNWGKNLIQGIINGIMNMIGAVKNAVGQVAGTIGNFLGFHSPAKEGPGREADKWAPAFINMYVAGLHAGMPKVNAALTQLTTPTTANKNAFAIQGGSSASGSGGYGVMNLQINLDGKVLTEVVSQRMAKETRINGYRSR